MKGCTVENLPPGATASATADGGVVLTLPPSLRHPRGVAIVVGRKPARAAGAPAPAVVTCNGNAMTVCVQCGAHHAGACPYDEFTWTPAEGVPTRTADVTVAAGSGQFVEQCTVCEAAFIEWDEGDARLRAWACCLGRDQRQLVDSMLRENVRARRAARPSEPSAAA